MIYNSVKKHDSYVQFPKQSSTRPQVYLSLITEDYAKHMCIYSRLQINVQLAIVCLP